MVTPGSYIVATDGSMRDLYDVPRGEPDWKWNHPTAAAAEFAKSTRISAGTAGMAFQRKQAHREHHALAWRMAEKAL